MFVGFFSAHTKSLPTYHFQRTYIMIGPDMDSPLSEMKVDAKYSCFQKTDVIVSSTPRSRRQHMYRVSNEGSYLCLGKASRRDHIQFCIILL